MHFLFFKKEDDQAGGLRILWFSFTFFLKVRLSATGPEFIFPPLLYSLNQRNF